MPLFAPELRDWKDWGRVYDSREAFAPLAAAILAGEGLPVRPLELCTPGTNANFRVGGYLLKIFAPEETGAHPRTDWEAECFGLRRARELGVSAPRLVARGRFRDRYTFWYIVTDFLEYPSFEERRTAMTPGEKRRFGAALRAITDRLHRSRPCPPGTDLRRQALASKGWDAFPPKFRREREAFIRRYAAEDPGYVHGDLCGDNLLVREDGEPVVLDFADGTTAPAAYEQALVAVELFRMDPAFLAGYFGAFRPEELARLCVKGLLIHPYGGEILEKYCGAAVPDSLPALEKRLLAASPKP